MSWGRPFRLISPLVDKSSPESTPLQVECGWGFTSILTQSGNVLVFWPQSGRIFDHLQVINSQFDQQGIETKAKISADHPEVIPCHVWDLQGFDPVILPPIPENLPEIPHTGLSVEEQDKPTKLIKISGMDNNIIGLTNKGHVLRFDGLNNENSYSRGRWEYLPHFSEVTKVREDPTFSREAEPTLEPPSTMLITHISAHFKTFVAYSTGPQSVVLIGKFDTDNIVHPPNEELKPTMIPYLQYQSVISVVIGDYHYGALTSAGKLLTWGAFSNGALGLGDPTKIEDGQPGGFRTREERLAVMDARGHMPFSPPDVRVPTEVKFDHMEKSKKEKSCFVATAGGWHTGALVVDLEPEDESEGEEEEALDMPGAFPTTEALPPAEPAAHAIPLIRIRGGMMPFRIGFAGRGLARGHAGLGGAIGRGGPNAGRGGAPQ
ncbi:hypothetical protein PHLCEN_2v13084 [Hermanssonia centrifuga]|uniref:Uncharacterized protein n=1 Tax=Hermanssonia centrifuga TaxID=98765 RepID=A0A2R6NFB3_9APHY|nr:hypothetical protein PHLCEN_2v13084 [Hermanssonia centrifuga]